MSTFSGKIQEIPNISVDRFDGNNLNSEAYFLSHCHSDHMVGLTWVFKNHLIKNRKYLYASEISCAILNKQFPGIQSNIKALDINAPTMITLKDGNVSVLSISAGHCPGSVMFLFETDTCVLYTGDYRINKNDVRKIKSFYDSFNKVKSIDKIYLDTTFFLKRYLKFPKRKESVEELCNIMKEWTCKGKNYCTRLQTSAKYGYECLFKDIYVKIGMPVHVSNEAFSFYSRIPEMDKSVTLDGAMTQIHCSCGENYKRVCDHATNSEIRNIKVSAFRWKQDDLENGFSSGAYDMYYVCYSTHASYEEGVELLTFLRPKSVEVCVKHDDPHTNFEMLALIEEVLDECRPKEEEEFKHKLFEIEENVLQSTNIVEEETGFNIDTLGILDSPPRCVGPKSKHFEANISSNVTRQLRLVDKANSLEVQSTEVDELIFQKELDVVELENVLNTEEPPTKKLK